MREKSPHSCYFVLLPKVFELLKAIIIIWFPIHSSLHSFIHPLSITACVLQGQRGRRYPSKYLCTEDSVSRSRAFQTTNLYNPQQWTCHRCSVYAFVTTIGSPQHLRQKILLPVLLGEIGVQIQNWNVTNPEALHNCKYHACSAVTFPCFLIVCHINIPSGLGKWLLWGPYYSQRRKWRCGSWCVVEPDCAWCESIRRVRSFSR